MVTNVQDDSMAGHQTELPPSDSVHLDEIKILLKFIELL